MVDTNSGRMHIVMLPWLAFGHILPFTELAKRKAGQGHRVTLLSTPRNTRRLIDVPPDLAEHLPEDAEASIDLPSRTTSVRSYFLIHAYDTAFAPALADILQALEPSKRPDWVVTDGVPCVHLSLFGAAAMSFLGPAEALMGRGKYAKASPEDLTVVPNFVPFPTTVAYRAFEARQMFAPLTAQDDSGVSELYRFGKSIAASQLVGIRTSSEFEPEWLQMLGELYQKPVIPVGFFPPPPKQAVAGHEAALRWLDSQAPGSVVYAAFGSEAKLTSTQLESIALGLEASGLPFLWAFRAPAGCPGGLPDGFEDRAKCRGIVCRSWVPQARFLAHGSVGAFLTHAGWNSVTEGLSQGVRLVLLPLMFDQGLNARLLVEKKVGVEVARDEEDGSFAPGDIAAAVRKAMVEDEGKDLEVKAKELARVFGNDELNDQCVRDFLRYLLEYSRLRCG